MFPRRHLNAYRLLGRGGALEPGSPSQHRYWHVSKKPKHADPHVLQLFKELKALSVSNVYNPPGDGLCFWYAIANGLHSSLLTHDQKLRAALTAQRATIAHIRQALTKEKK